MQCNKIQEFFKDKKVLITGHTGFVGVWLCLVLNYFGADVVGFSLQEEENSLYERVKKNIRLENWYGDLRKRDEIQKCIESSQPDIVFHLAAYSFIRECKNNPYVAFSSNVMGTVNLLEIVKDSGYVKTIVTASSDKVYQNTDEEMQLFSEGDALGGIDPYSCSKTCEDIIIQSYFNTYLKEQNKSVTILRPSNIIGGGDHNVTRLIPSIINSIKNNKRIEIRNPQSVRPWQYILDAVDAYIVAAINSWNINSLQIYNVGPTQENIRSVGEIAEILLQFSKTAEYVCVSDLSTQLLIEKKYLGLSIEKIKEKIGWEPRKKLEDALRDTYNFYKEWDKGGSYELCQKHIQLYYGNL